MGQSLRTWIVISVKAGGTGLGLYLTRKIATELLKGSVEVQSKLDDGTVFYLSVPKEIEQDQINGDAERFDREVMS